MWVRDLRAVTFSDFGTLRRPLPPGAVRAAILKGLEARGLSPPPATFVERWDRAMASRTASRWSDLSEKRVETILEEVLHGPVDGLGDVAVAAIESLAPLIEWTPDALPTLDFLRESGYRLGVVSDSPFPFGPTWHVRLGPWTDAVLLSRDVGRAKPHPSLFREALGRLGVRPKQVVHVGDQLVADVFGAKELGLRTALLERVPRDPPSPESLAWLRRERRIEPKDVVPDLTLRTLEDLPAVLGEFG